MEGAWKRPGPPGLAADLAIPLASVLAVNAVVFGLGWDSALGDDPWSGPALPGWVVGAAWVVLFAMMWMARWALGPVDVEGSRRARGAVVVLMASCLLWPFYSLAIGSQLGGLIGNLWTIGLASFVAAMASGRSRVATALLLPVPAWVALATVLTYGHP